jgi:hypothetical protein
MQKDTSSSDNEVTPPFLNSKVEEVFNSYPTLIRKKLLFLRELIFDIASKIREVGELEEALKWSEASYLTSKSKSGSTIRVTWKPSFKDKYVMNFNCNTNLIETFRRKYPFDFIYGGKRSLIFNVNDDIAVDKLCDCISIALTYHLNKAKES